MEILFAIILTSCVLGSDNEMYCEDFQVHEPFKTEKECTDYLPVYIKELQEFEEYKCEPVQYKLPY